jgi:nickel transport protein
MAEVASHWSWFQRRSWLGFLALSWSLSWGAIAQAHGVDIRHQTTQATEIEAKYNTGEPLANAQVTVYAPNGETPWLKGTTNDKGQFTFTPDVNQPGNWQVTVRLAGHGDILTIPVSKQPVAQNSESGYTQPIAQNSQSGYTPLQKAVMTTSVLWGLVGTALFFSRRKA